ncbi:NAD/NADP octopine/nopaline dehydrogenase family protein (plasmid) [Mesorhizobium sp. AR10]|uniref:NAD/NADP octopine/nopaline dehydrogenase family protein n=1 Tax=Mesorhizobium sp. AR10 TaxID=2865839 RepID=UPI002160BC60|nr:NAD/NADP octopine/nopaline dehydrogenase family protein [Mesorhizobium sp. AR10]UVK35718.1 NAD/NADP octopine/nopaline dehydrogenase family protein [Mesorhizobium sp. AR10]
MLRITVCGHGPIAHSIALISGYLGHSVRVLVSDAAVWSDKLRGRLPSRQSIAAPLEMVSQSAGDCIPGSDIVAVCVPASQIAVMLKQISAYVSERMVVGAIPGFGGFGIAARNIIPHASCLFGTQRIPFVVRSHIPGRSVTIGGIRRQTFVGTMPACRSRAVSELLTRVLDVPTVPVSHYVNVELSPSNSIVNPIRLYSLFGGKDVKRHRLEMEFFIDWDLPSSRLLLRLDEELQHGRRLIPRDTSFVAPILLQYDANDEHTLTDRFRSLTALAGRPIPAKCAGDAIELDPASAYVTEDIDVGLATVRSILRLAGAKTPVADEIIDWRRSQFASPGCCLTTHETDFDQAFPDIESLMRLLD